MSSLVRISFKRLTNNGTKFLNSKKDLQIARAISSRTTKAGEDRPWKPAPYPYQEKSYTLLNYFLDKTTSRLDENSKILVVDGPIAAGKSKFAREIADEFEMLYMPEANLDMKFINSYGYDLRKLDSLLPEACRSFDVMDFLRTPMDRRVVKFQIDQYITRLSQYIDALAHLLSTGQGVVLDRSVYSDFVFVEAMYSRGYLSKKAYKKYYEFRSCTIEELLRPHLVIYLDVPVPKVLENIKKRNISYEKNSTVLTPEYLSVMEKHYKQNYLKEISKHAELLVYDWSEEGDVEVVIEDIERLTFDFDYQDPHLKDWNLPQEEEWAVLRHKYADKKDDIMMYTNIPCWEVPELVIDAMDAETYWKVLDQAPGEKYEVGFNKDLGDSGTLFKLKGQHRDTLPLRERRTV